MDNFFINLFNTYIIIFLFPGLLTALIYRYTSTGKMFKFQFLIIYASLFSVINIIAALLYVFFVYKVDLIEEICYSYVTENSILHAFTHFNKPTLGTFIKIVYTISVPIWFILIIVLNAFNNNRTLSYWMIKFHITSRTEPSVWSDFLYNNKWILVRDFENDLAYYGHTHSYSEEDMPKELYLRKVQVKNNKTLKTLYERDCLYLYLDNKNIVIESKKASLNNKLDTALEQYYKSEIPHRPKIAAVS